MVFPHLIQLLRPNVTPVCVRCGAETSLHVLCAFSFFPTLGHTLGKLNLFSECVFNLQASYWHRQGESLLPPLQPAPSPPACSMGSFSGQGRWARPLPKEAGAGLRTSETQCERIQHQGDQFLCFQTAVFWPGVISSSFLDIHIHP